MNPKIIVIDGKTYNRVENMPPDVRQKYEAAMRSPGDANNNRIPDAFENMNILAGGAVWYSFCAKTLSSGGRHCG